MKRGNTERRLNSGRKQRQVVLIITEGAKTEPLYFSGFRAAARGRYTIKIMTSNVKDALGLTAYAKDQKKRLGLSTKMRDSAWVVFDTDSNSQERLDSAQKLAKASTLNLAMSNPCFELWYLLHFEDRTSPLSKEELYLRLRDHIPGYKKNQDYFDLLSPHRDRAIQRAAALDAPYDKPLSRSANPLTGVWRLVRELEKREGVCS